MRRVNDGFVRRCIMVSALVALGVAGFVYPSSAATNTFPESGSVGVGTMTPQAKLHLFQLTPDPENHNALTIDQWYSTSLGGADYYKGIDVWKWRFNIPDGVVDSGYHIGVAAQVYAEDANFAGTIQDLYGFWTRVGIVSAAPAGARTVTNAYGIYIENMSRAGTIINNYGMYQSSSTAKNYFAGNVGIGTTAPTAKLHVAGDAQVDGNIAAKYQDVAEWVPTRAGALAAGTVVVIDALGKNQVLPAAQPYDSRVAGVVSAQPGVILGEGGEGRVKVAHSGRVPMKVDASYGPIAVGDLLVTSPTPGYAMHSTPVDIGGVQIHRPGTVVGKALEPFAEGQGEILVLLTLQ